MSALIPYPSYPLGSPNTGIIPRAARAIPNAMRNVTPAARAGMAGTGMTAGAANKLAGRVIVAKTAYDLARLGLSEDARNEAAAQVEEDAANTGAVGRFFGGLLDPVNTAYGITRLAGDAIDSSRAAGRAAAAAPTDEQIAAKRQQTINVKARKQRDAEAAQKAAQEAAANNGFGAAVEDRLAAMMQDQLSPKELATFTPSEREAARLQDELTPEELETFMLEAEMQKSTPEQAPNQAPDQAPNQAPDQALVEQLFKTTHGTPFDPKSSRDKRKRAEIEDMLGEMGGGLGKTTPNQFALQLYRKYYL